MCLITVTRRHSCSGDAGWPWCFTPCVCVVPSTSINRDRWAHRAVQEQERLRQRVKQELLQELEQEQADAELERRAQQIQLERQIETLKDQLVRAQSVFENRY